MKYNLINLTPHNINIIREDGRLILALPRSGRVARCDEEVEDLGTLMVDGVEIPIIRKSLGKVENLPEPQARVFYIVSLAVAKAVPERDDLLVPGQAVRDEQGRIIGTSALAKV